MKKIIYIETYNRITELFIHEQANNEPNTYLAWIILRPEYPFPFYS